MFWTIFFGLIFFCGLVVIGLLLNKKWMELRVLDPDSIPESLSKKKKQELLRQRIERTGMRYAKKAKKDYLRPVLSGTQDAFRRFAGKLTAAERRYQQEKNRQAAEGGDTKIVDDLMAEAERFVDDQVFDLAEKKLIQVIGLDARNSGAYEMLGRVYLSMKDYQSAKETFLFLHKLDKKDASVIASLGEVHQKLGDEEGASKYFEKAVDLSPKNPKYLDLWIGSVINSGDAYKSRVALDRLVEVNPENKKIGDFERRIDEMMEKKKVS